MSNETNYSDNYDRNITSAETAARQAREGDDFRETPDSDDASIDTTSGYTVDREGLLNNYPIEPEMYIEEPGDLKEKLEAEAQERVRELREINQEGGKGPGII